jgi:3-hydroxyacyl-CoA dehydrogenase
MNLAPFSREGNIGIIRIDHPPVNALSHAVVDALAAAVESFRSDASLAVLVICAAGRTFVAGADVTEFSRPVYDAQPLRALFDRIESLDRPVVAVMHGTTLGAGLELALACHYRFAHRGTSLGLPEVLLGLLPGAGGTQRLPRLVDTKLALDLMLTGRQVGAAAALESGLVDAVDDGEPLVSGLAYARLLVERNAPPRPTSERKVTPVPTSDDFFSPELERALVEPVPARSRIVRCVSAAATYPYAQGAALEAQLFEECRASVESQALRHVFFAEREAAKPAGLPQDLALRPVATVGVLGAGTMGGGIAMCFANAGIPVTIVEANAAALDRGLGLILANYEASVRKGRLTAGEVAQRMALITGSLDDARLAACDLVIEAVFESMEVKRAVCARLGAICKPGAIIASNTSTLDLDVLAEASGRAGDVVGLHFFSPANVMRLLEVVRGARTAPDVLATVMQLARKIRKVAVVSGVCYGFIGNRMLESYLRETDFLLLEGASAEQIDRALEGMGMAMGPCRMLDLVGLDVGAKTVIEQERSGSLPPDPAYRILVRRLAEAGRLGQKSGAGYYRYKDRQPQADPETARICADLAKEHGITRRTDITVQEIVERCLYPLINEGARILEEGIAARGGDIDTVWVNGYGFPAYRGGPLFMADQIGLWKIVARLGHYATQRGNRFDYWTCSPLLADLAESGTSLAGWRSGDGTTA